MPMTAGGPRFGVFYLTGDQPAYLEVKLDPTAHGPSGVGPVTRGVTLRTSSGQQFEFELRGTIVK
mgnify:CR=1 FL=1